MMIDFNKVEDIKYEFSDSKTSSVLFKGLKENGPVDLRNRIFKNIEITTLCPEKAQTKMNFFLKELEQSLNTLFRVEDVVYNIITYNYQNLRNKVVDDALVEKPKNKTTQKIILHYHDKFVDKYDADYYVIKRELLAKGLSTQGLLQENFPRDLRRERHYTNNIACGIYAKVGGRPWGVFGAISNILRENTIYIGFDVSTKRYDKATHTGPGCVVVYDEKGQYVYHFTENFPIYHDSMEHDVAKNLMEMTIARVQQKKSKPPKNIVFIRDGDIVDSELQGFKDAIAGKEMNLHIIEARKRGNIPILKKTENGLMLSDSGTYMKISTGNKIKPFDIFVQNLGNDIFLPSMPRALKITPLLIDKPKVSLNEYMKDIVRQIFVLSNLNWSCLKGRTILPIVVHYAHEAGNLMRIGVNPKNIDAMALWML